MTMKLQFYWNWYRWMASRQQGNEATRTTTMMAIAVDDGERLFNYLPLRWALGNAVCVGRGCEYLTLNGTVVRFVEMSFSANHLLIDSIMWLQVATRPSVDGDFEFDLSTFVAKWHKIFPTEFFSASLRSHETVQQDYWSMPDDDDVESSKECECGALAIISVSDGQIVSHWMNNRSSQRIFVIDKIWNFSHLPPVDASTGQLAKLDRVCKRETKTV